MAPSETLAWDREALDRFREAHPEYPTVQAIAKVKTGDDFAAQFATDRAFPGGDRQARRVYNIAKTVAASTAMVWRGLQELAAPGTARFQNVPGKFSAHQAAVASYPALFGGVSNVAEDHGRSVYSEGAYFVDLMRFVQEHITGAVEVPPGLALTERRPDLMDLKLDEATAYEIVPYIDLVIEALESIVTSDYTKEKPVEAPGDDPRPSPQPVDPYAVLASETFPPALPFNSPLAEIRAYLSKMKTSLREIYATLESPATPIAREAALSEVLQLSGPSELSRLVQPWGDARTLGPLFGGASLDDLKSVPQFLTATGLSHDELVDLVTRQMGPAEVNAGLTRLFFVNRADDGLGPLRIVQTVPQDKDHISLPKIVETLENLSYAKLDRVYRFVRLARKLGWDFATLERVLRSLAPVAFVPETVLQLDGVSDFLAASGVTGLDNLPDFTIEAWVCPEAINRDNPVFVKGRIPESGKTQTQLLFWIDTTGHLAFSQGAWKKDSALVYNRSSTAIPPGEFSKVAVAFHTPPAAGKPAPRSTVTFFINGREDLTLLIVEKPGGSPQQTIDNRVPEEPNALPAGGQPLFPAGGQLADVYVGRDLDEQHYFRGLIKDVRFWRTARSEALVSENLFKRLTGTEAGLAAYWPLSQILRTELPDLVPGGKALAMGGPNGLVTQPVWVTRDLVLDPLPGLLTPRGFHFDGKEQYMAVRDATGLQTGQLTLEAWVTLDSLSAPLVTVVSRSAPLTELLYWGVDAEGHLLLRLPSSFECRSAKVLTAGPRTHVGVSVLPGAPETVTFFFNGVLESVKGSPPAPEVVLPGGADLEILVGRDLGAGLKGVFLSGVLQELRLWGLVRSAADIAHYMKRSVPTDSQGLIGYWRLNTSSGADPSLVTAQDSTYNGNHLLLGGIHTDFEPGTLVNAQLPDPPMKIQGSVLHFDGENDYLVVTDPANMGLGASDRVTVEFWFQADDVSSGRQVLFSQGDKEAGVNVYLQVSSESTFLLSFLFHCSFVF